jgi:hypothetical protein
LLAGKALSYLVTDFIKQSSWKKLFTFYQLP